MQPASLVNRTCMQPTMQPNPFMGTRSHVAHCKAFSANQTSRAAYTLRRPIAAESLPFRMAPATMVKQALSATLGFSLAVAISAAPATAEEAFSGVPRVVDGDTIVVGDKRVRLYGIDAPESKQSCKNSAGAQFTCGLDAGEKLKAKIGGDTVRCVQRVKDQYGRIVAVCSTPKFELNEWMVKEGLAVAYRQYGKEYVGVEEEAKAAKRGIWSGEFDVPSDWRKERKIEQLEKSLGRNQPAADSSSPSGFGPVNQEQKEQQAAKRKQQMEKNREQEANRVASQEAQMGCPNNLIKGNISANGAKIYHKPGDRSYATTIIVAEEGERYFCSEAEAQKAGWRGSK